MAGSKIRTYARKGRKPLSWNDKTVRISVCLEGEQAEAIRAMAKKANLSLSQLVRNMLTEAAAITQDLDGVTARRIGAERLIRICNHRTMPNNGSPAPEPPAPEPPSKEPPDANRPASAAEPKFFRP